MGRVKYDLVTVECVCACVRVCVCECVSACYYITYINISSMLCSISPLVRLNGVDPHVVKEGLPLLDLTVRSLQHPHGQGVVKALTPWQLSRARVAVWSLRAAGV